MLIEILKKTPELIDPYISIFGKIGGLLFLFVQGRSMWRNRNRITIHSFTVELDKPAKGMMILMIELENLGAEDQSLKSDIKINCIDSFEYKTINLEAKINGDRTLPANQPKTIVINLSTHHILFYRYINIALHTAKPGSIEMRCLSLDKGISPINRIWFFIRKSLFRLWPSLYMAVFRPSKRG